MKRLLLAAVIAGAGLAGSAPANATIIICDNMPVMTRCYWVGGGRWCDVYVAPRTCVQANKLIGPIGA